MPWLNKKQLRAVARYLGIFWPSLEWSVVGQRDAVRGEPFDPPCGYVVGRGPRGEEHVFLLDDGDVLFYPAPPLGHEIAGSARVKGPRHTALHVVRLLGEAA